MDQEITSKSKQILFIGAFLLAFYWVIAIWNFWSNFIDALGFNVTVFILGLLALFFYVISDKKVILKNYLWVIPIIFIGFSFSLYENPFLKVVNVLLLPLIFSIFFAYSLVPKNRSWSVRSLSFIFNRVFLLARLGSALRIIFEKLNFKSNNLKFITKIILGLLILLTITLTIIIPLLSAADSAFGEMMHGILKWFYDIASFRYFGRVVFALLFGLFLMSYYLSFDIEKKLEEKAEKPTKLIDPVVSGIVLSGILLIYILFLLTQLSHLWTNQSPLLFKDTERLVKSGFWQLLFLSVINIVFFLGYYRKINNLVQNILKFFSIASLLLLVSAGQRMFLYVFYYGFSYEKFFASYAVIYCFLVFVWLIYQLINKKSGDILKFLIFSLLWMYSVLTILPVERIVFNANIKLSQRKDSRIDLYELKMFSSDVLPLVLNYRQDEEWQKQWNNWVKRKIENNNEKKWYEKNIGNLIDVKLPKNWDLDKEWYERETSFTKEVLDKITWKTYQSDTLGIKLDYPSSWGELKSDFVRSTCPRSEKGVITRKGLDCIGVDLFASSINVSSGRATVVSADVNRITPANNINMSSFCDGKESGCELIKTPQNIYVAKTIQPITGEKSYFTRLLYSKTNTCLDITFSAEKIKSEDYVKAEDDLEKVVSSLVFLP